MISQRGARCPRCTAKVCFESATYLFFQSTFDVVSVPFPLFSCLSQAIVPSLTLPRALVRTGELEVGAVAAVAGGAPASTRRLVPLNEKKSDDNSNNSNNNNPNTGKGEMWGCCNFSCWAAEQPCVLTGTAVAGLFAFHGISLGRLWEEKYQAAHQELSSFVLHGKPSGGRGR